MRGKIALSAREEGLDAAGMMAVDKGAGKCPSIERRLGNYNFEVQYMAGGRK